MVSMLVTKAYCHAVVQWAAFRCECKHPSRGESMVEYGMVLALLIMGCIVAFTNIGQTVSGWIGDLTNSVFGIDTAAR